MITLPRRLDGALANYGVWKIAGERKAGVLSHKDMTLGRDRLGEYFAC